LKPGTIFRWNNFPYPKIGNEIKSRWFICLGDTGLLSYPILIHMCTTTTSMDDFKRGGTRESHRVFSFEKKRYPCFDEDCILDFDERPYSLPEGTLGSNSDIEIRGELDKQTLKAIYEGILESQFYSPRILLDIHTSLNKIGITGLRKP
jgi:hypothetical protein